MKLKIGILLPRSDMFPVLGMNFLNGLKLSLSKNQELIPEIIIENIGVGADESVLRLAEKFILQEGVDITISFCSFSLIDKVTQLFDSYQKPLIHVDLGANILENTKKSAYVIHHTLNLWQSCYLTGLHAAKKVGKKAAITASFYDGGYKLTYAFVKGFTEGGGEIVYNYVSPMDYKSISFDDMIDGIKDNDADVAFSAFSYKEADKVYAKIAESGINEQIPFFVIPTMADESYHTTPFNLQNIFSVASWSFDDENELMQSFITDFQSNYDVKPNIIALLGFEVGLSMLSLLIADKRCSAVANYFKETPYNSPRGLINYNESNETYVNPFRLRKFEYSNNEYHNFILKNIDLPSVRLISEKESESLSLSGWKNPYICT